MDIQMLLNPTTDRSTSGRPKVIDSPCPATSLSPSPFPHKVAKLPKDAAIFSKGKPRGAVNYPPYEDNDDKELAAQLRKFQIYPLGHIAEFPRHIPYNSEKKHFLEKTGRGAFEVFQYTFKRTGKEREFNVMWDYNNGLVRITPFFKCCEYSKTTPARVLTVNPGLRDISHSITGGALAAQGYWMPYECARAVAATFCWEIRHALIPLFGKEFPDLCTERDSPNFANFKIEPSIVRQCKVDAQHFRTGGSLYDSGNSPADTLESSRSNRGFTSRKPNDPKPRVRSPRARGRGWTASDAVISAEIASPPIGVRSEPALTKRPADIESGYGTDTDRSDRTLVSPQGSPPKYHPWTAVNRDSCRQQDEHYRINLSPVSLPGICPSSSPTMMLISERPFLGLRPPPHPLLSSIPTSRVDSSAGNASANLRGLKCRPHLHSPARSPPSLRQKRSLSASETISELSRSRKLFLMDVADARGNPGSGCPSSRDGGKSPTSSSEDSSASDEARQTSRAAAVRVVADKDREAAQLMMQLSVADAGLKV